MKKNLITAILMTLATTLLLGIVYPLVVTTLAQLLFHDKANGQLISRDGKSSARASWRSPSLARSTSIRVPLQPALMATTRPTQAVRTMALPTRS